MRGNARVGSIEDLRNDHDLFRRAFGDVVRLPVLVKGALRVPPPVDIEDIEAAFAATEQKGSDAGTQTECVTFGNAFILREKAVSRSPQRYTGRYVYHVLPLFDPDEVIERDRDRIATELACMPFEEVLAYVGRVSEALQSALGLVGQIREISRLTSGLPDRFLDAAYDDVLFLANPDFIGEMVDRELGSPGVKGRDLLDSWVEVPTEPYDGIVWRLAGMTHPGGPTPSGDPRKVYLRAMPTRQLHITAGNAPAVPLVTAIRAIATKSPAVIKSPYGATLPAALLALAAYAAAPEHPLTRNLSIVYWPGGDERIESRLFLPSSFDRIVVWGSAEAVGAVRARAGPTKVICLAPRCGMSWIGKEAFEGDALKRVVACAARDTMIWNQKACIASLIHYVEGDEAKVSDYAEALQKELARWDRIAPNFIPPEVVGRIRRMRRGKLVRARWLFNETDGDLSSAVVVAPGQVDLLDHPMSRLVIVRMVSRLEEALAFLHQGVSAVGVFPESRRMELCDRMVVRGVTSVFPLGSCERIYAGMAHDGMKVLAELVDWKNR